MRKFSVFSVLSLLLLLITGSLSAQGPFLLKNPYLTNRLCGPSPSQFTDDGGPAGNYSPSLNDSIQFFSALGTTGVIEVSFTDFVLKTGDTLYVYSSTGAPASRNLVVKLFENEKGKRGVPFKFYSRLNDGALRFVLRSDASLPKGKGWTATVREASASSTIDLLTVASPGSVVNDGDTVFKVCRVTTLNYDAIASSPKDSVTYTNSGSITPVTYPYSPDTLAFTYSWVSNDGTGPVTTRRWSQNYGLGSILYNLRVTTNNCVTYDTSFRVNVSTEPDFTGTSGDQMVCEGEDVLITGNVVSTSGGNLNGSPGYAYSPTITSSNWIDLDGGGFTTISGNTLRVPGIGAPVGTYRYSFVATDDYLCSYDSTISVTVNAAKFAGADQSATICGDDNAFDLNTVSDPAKETGGVWRDLDNTGFLLNTSTGIFNAKGWMGTSPIAKTARFSYFLAPNPGCDPDSSVITLTVFPEANAGTGRTITVCNTETALDLLGTGGLNTNQASGTWTVGPPTGYGTLNANRFLDLTTGGTSTSPPGYVEGGAPYIHTYTIDNGVCPIDQATLQIIVNETGVAGGDVSVDVCSGDPIIMLLSTLSGNPDNTGTWTITSPGVLGGTDPNRTFDPSAQTANGPFTATYRVKGRDAISVCADSTADVVLNFQISPDAGNAVAGTTDVCTDAVTYDLFGTLDGSQDTYGTWTDDNNLVNLSGANMKDVDLNSVNFGGQDTITGNFTYTVTSSNTICNTDFTTVQVRFTRKSNAGSDTSFMVCENDPIFFLIDVTGAPRPDNSATYSGGFPGSYSPSDNTARFFPATTGLAESGPTTITVTDTANGPGCVDVTSTITINVSAAPDAGVDSDTAKACINETAPYDLNTLLDATATPGGVWAEQGQAVGATPYLTTTGMVDTRNVSFDGCRKYVFEYYARSPGCQEDTSVHTLNVKCVPDAGRDDSTFVCSDDGIFGLFALLNTADTTGKFFDINGSGGLSPTPIDYRATFNPTLVSTNGRYPIAYVIDNNPCVPNDTAFLTVVVSRRPRAGLGDSATACENDSVFDLYGMLTGNFDQKGFWEIAMELPYDQNVNTTVNTSRARFFTGPDENFFDVAELVAEMRTSTSPLFRKSPPIFPPYIRFKYVVSDTTNFGPNPPLCPDSTTFGILEISKVFTKPTPKSATNTEVCASNCAFNLNSLVNSLDYFPYTGKDKLIWTATPTVAGFIDNDSILRACDLPPGDYSFTVTIQTAGCNPVTTAGILLRIVSLPNAGVNGTITVCEGSGPINISGPGGVLGTPDPGGSLTYVGTTPTSVQGKGTTTYTPNAADGPGTFLFEYTVVKAACPGTVSKSLATVIVKEPPFNSGNVSTSICHGEIIQLKTLIPNADPNGTFASTSGAPCSGAVVNNSPYATATFDATAPALSGLTCVVEYSNNNGVCPTELTQITINITRRPNAGNDAVDTVCSTNNDVSLPAILAKFGTADAGGIFTSNSPALSGNNFNATLVSAPTTVNFVYSVSAVGCPTDSSNISLFVEKAPQAGTDAFRDFCGSFGQVNLTSLLNGIRDNNGSWIPSSPGLLIYMSGTGKEFIDINDIFDNFGAGTYDFTYTVLGTVCPNDQSTLSIRITAPPKSGGSDTTVTVCETLDEYNLFDALGVVGTDYDLGGQFRDGAGISTSSLINPDSYGVGTEVFTYTVTSTICPTAVTKINLVISSPPDAGDDGADTIYLCASSPGTTINFNTYITNGSNGGTWELHSGSAFAGLDSNGGYRTIPSEAGKKGTIRYIKKAQGCANDTAFFDVSVNLLPAPLLDPIDTICLTSNSIDLNGYFASVTNTLSYSITNQAGTNNQAAINSGALSGNLFYPSFAGNGKYIITVTQSSLSCPNANSPLTIFIVGPGVDTTIDACIKSAPFDLVNLTKAQGIGGSWIVTPPPVPTGLVLGNTFFPNKGVVGTTYVTTLSTNIPNCTASATITIVDTISVQSTLAPQQKSVEILCNNSGTYQVRFKIVGGTPPYAVNGTSGSFSASDEYTSSPIPYGGAYTFLISSASNCGNLRIIGSSECGDADNDGVFDAVDLDDDNDGLPDLLESGNLADANADNDGNGTPNYRDPNFCVSIGGTLVGSVCSSYDFDGDQLINQYDLDSDNDGIADVFEGFDMNNGITFEGTTVNGMIDVIVDLNTVANGWHDAAEGTFGSPTYANYLSRVIKTTLGKPDFLNLDSDNDSISDFTEGAGSIFVRPNNTDNDPLLWDFRDLDSDNDGVADMWEGGMDGDPNSVPDTDGDGIPDFRELDADGDGMRDGVDSKVVFPNMPQDFDGDGKFNFQDIDSDNDNILDQVEKGTAPNTNTNPLVTTLGNATDYTNLDSDNDGICDIWEGHLPGQGLFDPVANSGGVDTLPDYRDLDSDGDLIPDAIEGGVDAGTACSQPVNTDGDNVGYDFRDTDSDNDGLSDTFEAGISPSSPLDSDGDFAYDFQDTDSDGDCIPDAVEAIAPYAGHPNTGANGDQAFTFLANSDVPDYLSLDSDGDGLLDSEEVGPDCGSPIDSDGDLFPDFRDKDSDNDGVTDRIEKDGDCDGDGRPNYQDSGDNCDITTFVPQGFSPNNDGTNDNFVIPDISEFPAASLKVFNRWGGLIFESKNYNNTWDGTYNSEDVPQGTYFYLLDLGIGKEAQKGYIYINR